MYTRTHTTHNVCPPRTVSKQDYWRCNITYVLQTHARLQWPDWTRANICMCHSTNPNARDELGCSHTDTDIFDHWKPTSRSQTWSNPVKERFLFFSTPSISSSSNLGLKGEVWRLNVRQRFKINFQKRCIQVWAQQKGFLEVPIACTRHGTATRLAS